MQLQGHRRGGDFRERKQVRVSCTLCGVIQEDRQVGPHMGAIRPDGFSCNVLMGRAGDKPGEYKGFGVHSRIYIGGVE